MRRVNGLAGLSRAIAAGATSAAVTQYRLTQAALYSTNSSFKCGGFAKYVPDQFGKSHPSISLGGSAFFSAAATSLAQEAYAKEPSLMQNFLPKEVVLYQYEACPFCNKVKAFLDYYNIPYKVVEVNPINKKEIKWSDYKKVPILKVDGDQMVDSSDIIMKLFQKIYPNKTEIECDEERFWFGWVDNHLVHLLSPNIYRSPSEALESFDYITTQGNFSFTERLIGKYAGAAAMYFVSKKLKKRHNITDERSQLYEAAEAWVDSLKGREYLGDTKPNLADLSVFGVLRPIRHLQAGRDMMKHTRIGEWYNRMESSVGQSLRIKE